VDAYRNFTTIPAPRLTPVDVGTLLQRVAGLVRPSFEKGLIALHLDVPEILITIRSDEGQLEMVLLNLLKNAREALVGTSDPTIWLVAYADGNRAIIEVTDNGPGIEPEALEQIFIPFFTTKKTGSGIGLSLSRQMLQQQGGQLTVQTEVGRGSTFRIGF
jgi:two-component system, NtrC family, nitrogen regulation sensor histidine kinase NtrY